MRGILNYIYFSELNVFKYKSIVFKYKSICKRLIYHVEVCFVFFVWYTSFILPCICVPLSDEAILYRGYQMFW